MTAPVRCPSDSDVALAGGPSAPTSTEALIRTIADLTDVLPRHGFVAMTISAAAKRLGTTTRALRHYEDEGLILPRRVNLLRVYDEYTLQRADVILRLRDLGLSIPDIAGLLASDEAESRLRPLIHEAVARLRTRLLWAAALDQKLRLHKDRPAPSASGENR